MMIAFFRKNISVLCKVQNYACLQTYSYVLWPDHRQIRILLESIVSFSWILSGKQNEYKSRVRHDQWSKQQDVEDDGIEKGVRTGFSFRTKNKEKRRARRTTSYFSISRKTTRSGSWIVLLTRWWWFSSWKVSSSWWAHSTDLELKQGSKRTTEWSLTTSWFFLRWYFSIWNWRDRSKLCFEARITLIQADLSNREMFKISSLYIPTRIHSILRSMWCTILCFDA